MGIRTLLDRFHNVFTEGCGVRPKSRSIMAAEPAAGTTDDEDEAFHAPNEAGRTPAPRREGQSRQKIKYSGKHERIYSLATIVEMQSVYCELSDRASIPERVLPSSNGFGCWRGYWCCANNFQSRDTALPRRALARLSELTSAILLVGRIGNKGNLGKHRWHVGANQHDKRSLSHAAIPFTLIDTFYSLGEGILNDGREVAGFLDFFVSCNLLNNIPARS